MEMVWVSSAWPLRPHIHIPSPRTLDPGPAWMRRWLWSYSHSAVKQKQPTLMLLPRPVALSFSRAFPREMSPDSGLADWASGAHPCPNSHTLRLISCYTRKLVIPSKQYLKNPNHILAPQGNLQKMASCSAENFLFFAGRGSGGGEGRLCTLNSDKRRESTNTWFETKGYWGFLHMKSLFCVVKKKTNAFLSSAPQALVRSGGEKFHISGQTSEIEAFNRPSPREKNK